MLSKEYVFISGLPRAGSTLLCNLLAQNPRFHPTPTSAVIDVLLGVRNQWDNLHDMRAQIDRDANQEAKLRVLRGILEGYYGDVDKPVVMEKSRTWLAHLEMGENILGKPAKVLVPVRDFRDVLASFEKLWRKSAKIRQLTQEGKHYFEFQSLEGRLRVWTRDDQPPGLAYRRVKDAVRRGFGDRMHFVRFEELTHHPAKAMNDIYRFLEEEPFEHRFDHVEQVLFENDHVHGVPGLHDIQSKVTPCTPQWPEVLGRAAEKYADSERF